MNIQYFRRKTSYEFYSSMIHLILHIKLIDTTQKMKLSINPIMHNVSKWSETLVKSCSKCLTNAWNVPDHFGILCIKWLRSVKIKLWVNFLSLSGTRWEGSRIRLGKNQLSRNHSYSLTLQNKFRTFSTYKTKSAGNCGFGHIYWRNPKQKTSFFV